MDTPAKPRSAKRRSAASRMASRVEGGSEAGTAAARVLIGAGLYEQTFVCQRPWRLARTWPLALGLLLSLRPASAGGAVDGRACSLGDLVPGIRATRSEEHPDRLRF